MPEEALTSFAYLMHIASLRVRHNYWGHKVGHAYNIEYQRIVGYYSA